jgi:hypothetical protein
MPLQLPVKLGGIEAALRILIADEKAARAWVAVFA